MNAARKAGAEALRRADRVLLTLGTAWVYEHNGQVVANCHRQPATEFVRRRLGVAEITGAFSALLAGPLAGKEVILTVSPVRHLGDGLEGNAVSKATLRLAAEELAAAHAAVHYFPAYEVLNDDLRDYRFYADDLVHPSAQAIQYVWGKIHPRSALGRGTTPAPRRAAHRRRGGAPSPQPPQRGLPGVLPPQDRRDRSTAAGRFSGRGGIFPQMYRNKFVNLRPITHAMKHRIIFFCHSRPGGIRSRGGTPPPGRQHRRRLDARRRPRPVCRQLRRRRAQAPAGRGHGLRRQPLRLPADHDARIARHAHHGRHAFDARRNRRPLARLRRKTTPWN